MAFENIRKVLDDFESTAIKVGNGESTTREDEATIFYSNLRLAEALLRDWSNPDKLATLILAEHNVLEKMEVKFLNLKIKEYERFLEDFKQVK